MKTRRILLLTVLVAGTACAGDLSYPPPGAAVERIPAGQGNVNRARPVPAPQAHTRDRQRPAHVLIDRRFRVLRPSTGSASATIAPATPSSPSIARAERPSVIAAATRTTDEFGHGLLWRIANDAGENSYLFGTIHVEDARVTQLPRAVTEAFDASRSVVVEAMLDQLDITQIGGRLVYLDGRSLRDTIDPMLFAQVSELLLQRGIPPPLATLMKPWAVALLLSQPPPKTGAVLDRQIYLEAKQRGKPVFGLETVDEQLAIFDGLSDAEQTTLLRETVRHADQIPGLIEQMIQAYLARDLRALERLAEEYRLPSSLQSTLQQKVVDERNVTMFERMLPRLGEGGAFIAVGALHLPGESGLLRQLKRRGYRVERVY